jgi:O-antigen/teichoic acid export membrane protein
VATTGIGDMSLPLGTTAPARRLRENVAANMTVNVITAAYGYIALPFYIRLLGLEGFGIISFYLSLQALARTMDFGTGRLLQNVVAVQSGRGESESLVDLLKTLEVVNLSVAFTVALGVATAGSYFMPAITTDILGGAIRTVMILFAISLAFQWLINFYTDGLCGLQRQRELGRINVVVATLRTPGAVAVLYGVSNSVAAFLAWQCLVSGASVWMLRAAFETGLGWRIGEGRFQLVMLSRYRRLAGGFGGIAVTSIMIAQLDKLVLIKILALREYGIYGVATSAASAIFRIVTPIFDATYPRLSASWGSGERTDTVAVYRRMNALVTALVIPVAVTLAAFANDILMLWTRDREVADGAASAMGVLAIANAANSLTYVPFALQLAAHCVRYALIQNVVTLAIAPESYWFAAARYGAVGAAGVWLVLNLGFVTVTVPSVHGALGIRESIGFFGGIGRSIALTVLIVGVGRYAREYFDMGTGVTLVAIGYSWAAASAANLVCLDYVRESAIRVVRARRQ